MVENERNECSRVSGIACVANVTRQKVSGVSEAASERIDDLIARKHLL